MSQIIALVMLILAAPRPPAPPVPPPDNQKEKVRAAIQHSCVRECIILKDHDESRPADQRDARQQACMDRCMDPKATAAAQAVVPPATWGTTKEDAIEVCLPAGEHYFLKDLRCMDGSEPTFERAGNVGPRHPMTSETFDESLLDPFVLLVPGKQDEHIIDRYHVTCKDQKVTLFLDMYHCGTPKPWAAPKGFTRPPRG